jgi:magnesium-transporting ATPase (P-type)
MEFKCFTVGMKLYGQKRDPRRRLSTKVNATKTPEEPASGLRKSVVKNLWSEASVAAKPVLNDTRLTQILKFPEEDDMEDRKEIMDYLTTMALCHTVTIDRQGDEEKYNAASPDELAFVEFVKDAGLQFKGIDSDEVVTLLDITQKG